MPIRPKNRTSRSPETPSSPTTSNPSFKPPSAEVRRRIRVRAGSGSEDCDSPGATPASPPATAKRARHKVDRSGANWDEKGDYLVGKGRPPEATRWKPGQSGNPRGPKPKEKADPLTSFENELMAEFTAKVNGQEVTLNLGSFVLQLLKAQAAKGTVKAQQILLELFLGRVRSRAADQDTPEMQAWEQELIDTITAEYGLPLQPVVRKSRHAGDQAGEGA